MYDQTACVGSDMMCYQAPLRECVPQTGLTFIELSFFPTSLASGMSTSPGHCSTVGLPSSLQILSTWSISPDPISSGRRSRSSPKMQPTDLGAAAVPKYDQHTDKRACRYQTMHKTHHMSTGVE